MDRGAADDSAGIGDGGCEEEERIRDDRQERRAAHAQLRAELERQAGAWTRARFLRRYIDAARRALSGKSIEASFRSDRIDFLDWATDYVNQLDPLVPTPLNPDLWPEQSNYAYPSEDGLKKLLPRLTGFDGHPHTKLTTLDDVRTKTKMTMTSRIMIPSETLPK